MTQIRGGIESHFLIPKIDRFFRLSPLFPLYRTVGLSLWHSVFCVCYRAFGPWGSVLWGESPAHSLLSERRVPHSCAGPAGSLENTCSARTLTDFRVGRAGRANCHTFVSGLIFVCRPHSSGWQQRKHHVSTEEPLPDDYPKIQISPWPCGVFFFPQNFSLFFPQVSTCSILEAGNTAVNEIDKSLLSWRLCSGCEQGK